MKTFRHRAISLRLSYRFVLNKDRAAVKGCGLSGVILTCMPMAPFGFSAQPKGLKFGKHSSRHVGEF